MKIVLNGLKKLEIKNSEKPEFQDGFQLLKVQYCAVCRTDAKMWSEGHRDLVFPRVLGHEIIAEDSKKNRFAIWPGQSCTTCRYCKAGRENLCEEMKITGFHNDGGFADYILASENALIPVPSALPSHIACFAEPTGCVLNALNKLNIQKKEKVIIYGGGTVGLIVALVCNELGAIPLVIEKNEEKIFKAGDFLKETGIQCTKDTTDSEFDVAFNACPDHIAFSLCIVKLRKSGRFSFFSGLLKNQHIETNLLNLIHYKEIELIGAYGLTAKNMIDAMPIMENNITAYEKLIEDIISPENIIQLMPTVLSGNSLKYILDFNLQSTNKTILTESKHLSLHKNINKEKNKENIKMLYKTILQDIKPVGRSLYPAAQRKIDNKTKPLGALGKLEELAVKLSLIQNTLNPALEKKVLFVFAADHGITEDGVSAFPSEVTAQMVNNFITGGAAINVLCRHNDIQIKIIDIGVNADFDDHPKLLKKKVRKGTRNFSIEEAMTKTEMMQAIEHGMTVFLDSYAENKIDIVGLGEMGIGNTTSASTIISAITGITPVEATGRGTGIDDKGLKHKAKIIKKALNFHKPNPEDGLEILRKTGGYEIAGIVGAVLAAASKRTAVVLDGVISTAAGLIAYVINPDIIDYLISGHKSVEIAQEKALAFMGISPVLNLDMRLGEGTGAAITINIVDGACKIMRQMASFDDAGVSR